MDRVSMVNSLGAWMEEGQTHFASTGRHAKDRSLVKSYLVEANTNNNIEEVGGISTFLASLNVQVPVEVHAGDDPTVSVLVIGKDNVEFYLDTFDARFWVLHTVAAASLADNSIRNLVQRTRLLDSIWLPSHHFEKWINEIATPRRMTARFALNTGIYRDSLPEDEFDDNSMLFSIGSSGNVIDRWRSFRKVDQLASMQALWSARAVRRPEAESETFSVADVTANGKVTARGNSFLHHNALLRDLLSRYRALITGWESTFRLGWEMRGPKEFTLSATAAVPVGKVAELYWPDEMLPPEQESLLNVMFNCGEPYRLYGTPMEQGDSRYIVRAVDLHTGDKLDIELLSSRMWVYLSDQACGNVLARLLTNLQHYYDARTKLHE